jgi:hypothetical protein
MPVESAVLLTALIALANGPKVTLECRAQTLSHLIEDLGRLTGRKLSVSRECANDVLLISVKDVEPSQLLEKIAYVDSGTWAPKSDGLIFEANLPVRRLEASRERARTAGRLSAAIRDALARGAENAPVDGDTQKGTSKAVDKETLARLNELYRGASAEQAIYRMLATLKPESLVLAPGKRIVLSTNPNASQELLGAEATNVLATHVGRQNAVLDQIESQIATAANLKDQDSIQKLRRTLDGPISQLRRIDGYAKADLALTSEGVDGSLSATLMVFDAKGAALVRSTVFVSSSLGTPGQDASEPSRKTPIRRSEEANSMRTMYRSQRTGNSAAIAIPPRLLPFFSDVEHNDPLALSTSDKLLAYAAANAEQLLAVVPDEAFEDAAFPDAAGGAGPSVEGVSLELKRGDTMSVVEADGWIYIKPTRPETTRQLRCDRSVLGSFMRACLKERIPTLFQFCDFALKSPDPRRNPVVGGFLSTGVAGFGNAGLGTIANWDLYRLYGGFSPDQQSRLARGAKVAILSLSGNQRDDLARSVFGSDSMLTPGAGPAPMAQTFPSSGAPSSDDFARADVYDEVTEMLPDGLPTSGFVDMFAASEPFVSPVGADRSTPSIPRVIGVAQLARRNFNLTRAGKNPGSGAILFDKFQLGSREVYALTVHLTPQAYEAGRLFDFKLAVDVPALSDAELPAEWKTEYDRIMTVLQKRAAGRASAKTPPPP